MVRLFVFVVFLILPACSPRAVVMLYPEARGIGDERAVFVSTTRKFDAEKGFAAERDPTPSYQKYVLSVPPDRRPGQIQWPKTTVDPRVHFVATEVQDLPSKPAFAADMKRAVAALPRGQREVTIYVHGFNNNFADGLFRIAQLSHDFKIDGVAVHYSWPSAANPLGYEYDRESQLFSRDGLEDLLRVVKGSGAERVLLVGHSMGALLVMETLRQMDIANPGTVAKDFSGVLLISPDIDIDVFRSQATRIKDLPEPFVVFVSEKDRALFLSALLSGERNRLGTLTDPAEVSDLKVTLVDVTEFHEGGGHFVLGNSAALISILGNVEAFDIAFQRDRAGRTGIIPGVILSVQSATTLILSPVTVLAQ